jgi:hypothetical protein
LKRSAWLNLRRLVGALLSSGAAIVLLVGVTSSAASATQQTSTLSGSSGGGVSIVSPNPPIPRAMQNTPPAPPTANAPMSAWKEWSTAQNAWIRSIPYSSAFASEGYTLVDLGFNTVTSVPGLPAGITETTAWWVVRPSSTSSTKASVQASTDAALTCASMSGPGRNCVSISSSFPATITASYEYLGSGTTLGHVELGVDGCPGSLAANSNDAYLSYGYSVGAFTSTTGSNSWSSRFWNDSGGSYHLWGTVFSTFWLDSCSLAVTPRAVVHIRRLMGGRFPMPECVLP